MVLSMGKTATPVRFSSGQSLGASTTFIKGDIEFVQSIQAELRLVLCGKCITLERVGEFKNGQTELFKFGMKL